LTLEKLTVTFMPNYIISRSKIPFGCKIIQTVK
jgi:hypothetical protein